ncbi:MAG: DUF459 domain-containing protein [Sphingomonas sp.]|uniref:SGNH/GDSL hydrolase family protein n=1 Tax=Sphingomonas sp. TaxID=28214 RepID=UPI001ACCC6F7|nr:DUF459 domain-containing protein [Sphingomonas sp.]MBN8807086.1 DUF459 domain-containing protein [Sphingomonas sp.]
MSQFLRERAAWIGTVDRAIVLLLGVAVGSAIGLAFAGGAGSAAAVAPVSAPEVRQLAASKPAPADAEANLVTECAPCFGLSQQLQRTAAQGGRVRVGVFGDSFGKGVWSGVLQQLPAKQGYDVTDYGQEAIGFTRYKSLNLEKHLADQLRGGDVDIAVVSFGANDAQGIITPEGHYAPFMGPLWQQTLAGRLDRYIGILRQHKALVYWVGLPRMRDPALDAQVTQINDFYHREMNRLGVPFLDSRPVASDAHGQFAPYLIDPRDGQRTLIRATDGIHMSMTGYIWITRDLVERIRRYVTQVREEAGVAAPVQPTKKKAA